MHPLDPAWQALINEFDTAQARAASAAKTAVSENLNQTARRLKSYKADTDWYDAVLDGAAIFAPETALFAVESDRYVLKGARGLGLAADLAISAARAAAFRNAVESGELVMALATANEVSDTLAEAIPVNRALVLPVSNGSRVAALLFCVAREGTDANALELIVTIASSVLERHSRGPAHLQIAAAQLPVAAAPAPSKPDATAAEPAGRSVPWKDVPESDLLQHLRAQRLARVKVAEMELYRPEACEAGRAQQNIYLFLKREIDSARETFRNQFLTTGSMVDYLHLELLARLAQNETASLGADYPGQMV